MEQDDATQTPQTETMPVSLDMSINDFVKMLGERNRWGKHHDRKGLPSRIYTTLNYYLPARFPNVKTLKDLDQFRQEGLIHNLGHTPYFGQKSAEYLNGVLREYGIQPIPWRPSSLRYRRHQR